MSRQQEDAARKADALVYAQRQKFDPRELECGCDRWTCLTCSPDRRAHGAQEVLPAAPWFRQVYNEKHGSW